MAGPTAIPPFLPSPVFSIGRGLEIRLKCPEVKENAVEALQDASRTESVALTHGDKRETIDTSQFV